MHPQVDQPSQLFLPDPRAAVEHQRNIHRPVNLFQRLHIGGRLGLVLAVVGSDGDGQSVHSRFLHKNTGLLRVRIRVGGDYLSPAHNAQLRLNGSACGPGQFHRSAGHLYILLQRQHGTVDHDGGKTALQGRPDILQLPGMVQMQGHPNLFLLRNLPHNGGQQAEADVFRRGDGDLQDHRRPHLLRRLDHHRDHLQRVDIERAHADAFAFGLAEKRLHCLIHRKSPLYYVFSFSI